MINEENIKTTAQDCASSLSLLHLKILTGVSIRPGEMTAGKAESPKGP